MIAVGTPKKRELYNNPLTFDRRRIPERMLDLYPKKPPRRDPCWPPRGPQATIVEGRVI